MASVLNTNMASIWATKNLGTAQAKMADSVERLSSGMRINRAKDDSAGLALSQALTSQINGANQGVRNLNDAVSMVQTAEGAISAATDMGQRILQLATQGANGTLGLTDRKAIYTEMKQLLTAIDAIGNRAKFSGNSLLTVDTGAGSATSFSVQSSNSTTDTVALNNAAFYNIGSSTTAATEYGTVTVQGMLNGQKLSFAGRTIEATETMTTTEVVNAIVSGTSTKATVAGTLDTGVSFTVAGSTNTDATAKAAGTLNWSFTSTGNKTDIVVKGLVGGPGFSITSYTQGSSGNGGQAGALGTDVNDVLSSLNTAIAAGTGVTSTQLDQVTSDFQAIQTTAAAYITSLTTQRGLLGAYQNQLSYTVDNVTELSATISDARSRVLDTDYATETASLTKGQILQQAATAMLAQANQMPNVILSLLK